jgi:hypothetical protein
LDLETTSSYSTLQIRVEAVDIVKKYTAACITTF